MIKKQGITLVTVVVTVIVLTILASTITFSTISTINYSRLSTWANEIKYIQDVVNEAKATTSSLPYTTDTVKIDIGALTAEQVAEQFAGETVTDNSVELNVLDLGILKITNTVYGNLKTVNDVYAYSITTGRVYYVQGLEIDGEMYHTLTEGLKNSYNLTSTNNNLSSIVFIPSVIGYTNEPINVTVKVPSNYTNVSITTSNTEIQVGTQTVVDNIYEYIVNTNNVGGNYEITVSYTAGSQSNSTKYTVNNYDAIKPVIAPIVEDNFVALNNMPYVKNVNATDESGIKYLKYIPGVISEEEAKTYFETNGNNVIDGKININEVDEYTIYAEDNAGNFAVYTFEKMYWNYAIYSATDNSLTFIYTDLRTSKGDTYNGKEVTEVYTGFVEAEYTSQTQTPWYNYRTNITSVTVEDTIMPISTAYWFYEFTNCTTLDVTKLDTSNVTTMKYMFGYTGSSTAVTTFTITGTDNWDTSKVTNMLSLFESAGLNAKQWNIGDLSKWNTSEVTNMYRMFKAVGRNAKVTNLGNLNTKEITRSDGTKYTAWDISQVTSMGEMFNTAGWYSDEFYIGNLDDWNTSKVTSMSYTFQYAGASDTTWSIGDLSKWNTSKTTKMDGIFQGAGENSNDFTLGKLDNWDTSEVTSMRNMFYQAGRKSSTWSVGDLSSWNTSNVTSMFQMFAETAYNVTETEVFTLGDISKWNTSKVTDMTKMFNSTAKTANWYLNLSNWDVQLVTAYEDFNSNVESKVIAPNFI